MPVDVMCAGKEMDAGEVIWLVGDIEGCGYSDAFGKQVS